MAWVSLVEGSGVSSATICPKHGPVNTRPAQAHNRGGGTGGDGVNRDEGAVIVNCAL